MNEEFKRLFAEAQGMDYDKVKESGHTLFTADTIPITKIIDGNLVKVGEQTREEYAKEIDYPVGDIKDVEL